MGYSWLLFAQAVIFLITLKIFTQTKGVTKSELLGLLLFLLNNVFSMQYIGNFALLTSFLLQFWIVYTRNKDWLSSLSTVSLNVIINILADHIATFLIPLIFQIDFSSQLTSTGIAYYLLFSLVFAIGLAIAARKFCENHQTFLSSNHGKKTFTGATMAILFVFYLNIIFEIISGNQKNILDLNLLFFGVLLLISGISLTSYIQTIRQNYETQQQKLEYEMIKIYTNKLEQQTMEIRKFRHDYQNILTSLEGYILKKDYSNLENYFFENIKPTGKEMQQNNFILKDLAKIKPESIKSLVAAKMIMAQERKINVTLEITEPIDNIAISSVTLIRMLGIILDNAIEATSDLDDRQLAVAFIQNKKSLTIITENTCPADLPKLHVLKKSGYSTKGANRGLGLSNLQELVNSTANCTLLTKIENKHFSQTITILDTKGE